MNILLIKEVKENCFEKGYEKNRNLN